MNRKNRNMTTYFVILSLLVIGIVYAILQANLQINGIAKIKSNSWDIHFDNIQINENSVVIGENDSPATIDPNNNCKIDFDVTLSLPGDFYEFTVDVVNAGTIDGMIGELNKTLKVNNEVVSEEPDFLRYEVTYDDGGTIIPNHLLSAGESFTYLVRLEYKTDIEELFDPVTISTSLEPQYIQADSGAIKKLPYYACTFDGEMVQGAEYTNGQYTYKYMQDYFYERKYVSGEYVITEEWRNMDLDGWGVRISDATSTDPINSRLCSSINDKPIVSMKNMFSNSQTISVDTTSFNTSNVVSMERMFWNASGITSIDVQNFNMSEVTNLDYMFSGSGLTSLDLSHLGGDKITTMRYFLNASNALKMVDMSYFNFGLLSQITSSNSALLNYTIESLNLSHANMSHITSFNYGFANMTNLQELDLSYADMRNATDFSNFARNNGKLVTFDMSYARTDHLESLYYAFKDDSILKNLYLTGINLESLKDANYIFHSCDELVTIDFSMFSTPNLVQASNIVYNCSKLEVLNLSNWGGNNLSVISYIGMNCPKLKKIIMNNFNFGSCNVSSGVFSASNLEELYLRNSTIANITNSNQLLYYSIIDIKKVKKIDMTGFIFGSSMNSFFKGSSYYLTNLEELKLTDCDTSRVTDMSYAFDHVPVTLLDISNWNVSNVTNMSYMFYYCTNLTSINIKNWNVSNVTDMSYMFNYCTNLTTVIATDLDAPSLGNTSYMFGNCQNLETLSITGWNAPSVNTVSDTFYQTPKLKTIDMTGWTLPLYVSNMFRSSSAETIILDNVENVHSLSYFFLGASSIKKISCKNWVIPSSFVNVFFRDMGAVSSVEELDVTGWDLSNTTDIFGLFAGVGSGDYGLKRIVGLNTWDTSNITNMSQMFQYLNSLQSIDLSSFNTSSVTNMSDMFKGCTSLTTGYARTQSDADKFNNSSNKPSGVTFVVRT